MSVMIPLGIGIFVLIIIELISNGGFMWWFVRHGLWSKKQYSIVLDSEGEVGIELTPNVALTLPSPGVSWYNILICSVPEDTTNQSLNSYWHHRGFQFKFDHTPLKRNGIISRKIAPSQWMLKRLESLYLEDLNNFEDMRKI